MTSDGVTFPASILEIMLSSQPTEPRKVAHPHPLEDARVPDARPDLQVPSAADANPLQFPRRHAVELSPPQERGV